MSRWLREFWAVGEMFLANGETWMIQIEPTGNHFSLYRVDPVIAGQTSSPVMRTHVKTVTVDLEHRVDVAARLIFTAIYGGFNPELAADMVSRITVLLYHLGADFAEQRRAIATH